MWWEQYGDSAPGLQQAAVRILSQVCSTSSFDRNWAAIQQIHSEKRNRLDKEILTDLLYVHSNLKLRSKGKATESDPIEKDEMEMTSDWVEETENPQPTQWLDRFNNAIFSSNDHIFGL
jgi:hAT family C-terminal dimerisation region